MTSKEKAESTIKRFDEYLKNNSKDLAKQCALIAVDEIIKTLDSTFKHKWLNTEPKIKRDYWQEVKTEIEKL